MSALSGERSADESAKQAKVKLLVHKGEYGREEEGAHVGDSISVDKPMAIRK